MTDDGWWFRRPRGPFTVKVIAAALAHANAEAPRESVGVVCRGEYIPLKNVARDPETAFEIDPAAFGAVLVAGECEGVIHSHPGGPWHPSAADMAGQIETDVPWAIVIPGEPGELACSWGLPNPPLMGADGAPAVRQFAHGVSDCYTLIRDWYAQAWGVSLPDVPRDWEWWAAGRDVYLDGMGDAGFKLVSADPTQHAQLIQPGDVFLRRAQSSVPNHGGVYIGDGLLIEQLPKSLACRRPIASVLPHVTHLLRYVG